jgi:hypothetical protein
MPVNPALRRLRQEDQEFKVSLNNLVKPCLKVKIKESGMWLSGRTLALVFVALGSIPSTS